MQIDKFEQFSPDSSANESSTSVTANGSINHHYSAASSKRSKSVSSSNGGLKPVRDFRNAKVTKFDPKEKLIFGASN